MKDYRRLSTPVTVSNTMQCKVEKLCDKMSIVYDHKHNHKVGGKNPLAVTKGQFCAMFYHVTERKRDKISFKCLEESGWEFKDDEGALESKSCLRPNCCSVCSVD